MTSPATHAVDSDLRRQPRARHLPLHLDRRLHHPPPPLRQGRRRDAVELLQPPALAHEGEAAVLGDHRRHGRDRHERLAPARRPPRHQDDRHAGLTELLERADDRARVRARPVIGRAHATVQKQTTDTQVLTYAGGRDRQNGEREIKPFHEPLSGEDVLKGFVVDLPTF